MIPRIAIPTPTSGDLSYNRSNWPVYAHAIRESGGEPVEFPMDWSPRRTAELANSCQAILLPGSPADVNPGKYGQSPHERSAAADLARENVDELLLQDAHNLYKPILGLCFGAQLLNVWRSGTLLQDLTVLPVNHAASRSVGVAHSITIAPRSLLAGMVAHAEPPTNDLRVQVNSSHHQAIGIVGDGLRISARCPEDGVVEAIEGGQASPGSNLDDPSPHHFVLGLQWHPERTFDSNAISRSIFRDFVQYAAEWTPRKVLTSVSR